MVDYKAMYYRLAGQMSIAVEGLSAITEKLKQAQQATEEMFINAEDNPYIIKVIDHEEKMQAK